MTHDELLAMLKGYAEAAGLRMDRNCWFILSDVVELHRPSGIFCRGCGFVEEYNEPAQLLPCPTIQAIEAVLND